VIVLEKILGGETMLCLVAYDGSTYGWDSTIKVAYGNVKKWTWEPGMPSKFVDNSREILKKIVRLMNYKVTKIREGNLTTIIEFAYVRNQEKLWDDFLTALELLDPGDKK